jgi:farnesyl-diphosphate farnesyltransferase
MAGRIACAQGFAEVFRVRGADYRFQAGILPQVSRTFALTIPQLPGELRRVVTNAYLLCRIADTIEDEPALEGATKLALLAEFSALVEDPGIESREIDFSRRATALLTAATPLAERQLVRETHRVLRLTRRFGGRQRAAIARCITIMSEGMHRFAQERSRRGLDRLVDLEQYCYYVAGVVGEMLTDLFCDHTPELASRSDLLMVRSVSFGQCLQMTNILKDVWEDWREGTCWLPREVFTRHGFDLAEARPGCSHPGFVAGMRELVEVARGHLRSAVEYTRLIPRREAGIRRFCLLALGLAGLTLRNIAEQPAFCNGSEVKVKRRVVYATLLASQIAGRSNRGLHLLFDRGGRPQPSSRSTS